MKRGTFKKRPTKPMKKTRLSKRGKSPESKLQKKADKLMQEYFTQKYPKCDICGKPTYCMHHFVEKSRAAILRYEEENLIPLCQFCHSCVHNRYSKFPMNNQNRSYDYVDIIINKRGGKAWKDKMESWGKHEIKTNVEHYQNIINYFTELINY